MTKIPKEKRDNPKAKGQKTEAIVLAELIKRDYIVLIPWGDNQRYDFVLHDVERNVYERIQCKTGKLVDGSINFNVASTRSNYLGHYVDKYLGQIEAFIVYCYETDKIYKVSIDQAPLGTKMKLRVLPTKQLRKVNWAKDYEI